MDLGEDVSPKTSHKHTHTYIYIYILPIGTFGIATETHFFRDDSPCGFP